MDFNLSAEQIGIQEALRRYISESYGFEHRRSLAKNNDCSREAWAMYAELGLLALPFPESLGGIGGNGVDLMLVMQGFGEGLLLEPYLATVIMAGGILARAGSARQQELVGQIAAGELRMAFGHFEPASRYDVNHVECSAAPEGTGWRLNGHKSMGLGAPVANRLSVSARVSGNATDRDGIGLFLLDPSASGATLQAIAQHDGTGTAEIILDNVIVTADDVIGSVGDMLPLIECVLDQATAALCAEA